ncbi:DUF3861 domain-containing protein [Ferrimonas lipolytica]|uniref:DUF3861 domain-containing protein n=1 Tax=Ferrimonas lipolytica TaxID=2724191 RepID=A0A6H1UBD8_9GAMM|nr:DUF3861 domain-containing protein [Ferrimonas lipolytica]QIZ76397.1 DUF3861 domain-containing protein [Ferrimonas lipolytica]
MKQPHHYRVTIEEIDPESQQASATLQFEFDDREDMLNVVDKIGQHSGLEKADATRVGVALRLLGPVMMGNRKHALFSDFMPHFKTFMHNLKTTVKQQRGL